MLRRQRRCCFLLLLLSCGGMKTTFAFTASQQQQPQQQHTIASRTSTAVHMGNWISGITGIPPSQPLIKTEILRELVATTNLASSDLKCVYKASRNGWSAIDFHQSVDGKGSALVVALSRSGTLFGGYNPAGWISSDDYRLSNSAFLWFIDKSAKPIKCPIFSGGKKYASATTPTNSFPVILTHN